MSAGTDAWRGRDILSTISRPLRACWVCGTKLSTLERKMVRSHQIGEPKTKEKKLGPASFMNPTGRVPFLEIGAFLRHNIWSAHDLSLSPDQTQPRWGCINGGWVRDNQGLSRCIPYMAAELVLLRATFYPSSGCTPTKAVVEEGSFSCFDSSLETELI